MQRLFPFLIYDEITLPRRSFHAIEQLSRNKFQSFVSLFIFSENQTALMIPENKNGAHSDQKGHTNGSGSRTVNNRNKKI